MIKCSFFRRSDQGKPLTVSCVRDRDALQEIKESTEVKQGKVRAGEKFHQLETTRSKMLNINKENVLLF